MKDLIAIALGIAAVTGTGVLVGLGWQAIFVGCLFVPVYWFAVFRGA